ncbi:pyocin knob domain-containing protein, partial [Lentilactobacillus hilgardii]|uniref:pyocin knob domain-containing protein n=1 Tax=Lentilactobacillus hilgardii TaxID=1588 RepID=UPI0021A8762E
YAKTVDVNQQLDKKVNVADMRKPASDVAGIEEVNAKQDAIAYTPADDSKVVHSTDMRKPASEVASINEVVKDNGDGSISFGGLTIPLKGSVTGDFDNYRQTGLYSYNTASGAINNSIGAAPDGILIVLSESNGNIYHFIITSYSERYFRIYFGGKWYDWRKQLFTEDLTAGLATKADDNKVAHLSGTNNFDNVPTVDDNPLLLASSLPSDLARTGQANTFSLLQTFSQGIKTLQTGSYDDANSLVNEGLYFNTNLSIKNGAGDITAGFIQVFSGSWERIRQIMYSDVTNNLVYTRISSDSGSTWSNWVQIITSDQVPTDLARTGQAQTFTAAQTFSIAPTIKDASTDKGDNQAATMADLKSVENSAWHQLDCSSISTCAFNGIMLYKIDTTQKNIYFSLNDDASKDPTSNGVMNAGTKLLDFSSVAVNVLSAHGYVYSNFGSNTAVSRLQTSGAFATLSDQLYKPSGYIVASMGDPGQPFAYIKYDSLVNN